MNASRSCQTKSDERFMRKRREKEREKKKKKKKETIKIPLNESR